MFLNITSAANKYSSIDCYFQKKKSDAAFSQSLHKLFQRT